MAQTTPPNVNPSPKARFQQASDNISKHRALISTHEFQRACDYALLDYQSTLAKQMTTANDAAANHFKITGALEFIQAMRTLGETIVHSEKKDQGNLDHRA